MLKAVTSLFTAILISGCVLQPGCTGIESADRTICAVRYDKNITAGQIQTLADQAARERAILVRYFGNDVGPITIIVRDKGIAYHEPPTTIHIPSARITKRYAITAHEMTHLLTQGWASQVLKEGLAVYTQYKFGEQQGWPNYERSVHAAAQQWLSDKDNNIRTPKEAEFALRTARRGERRLRLSAYSIAGSWVMWIVEQKFDGDIARFMKELYRSGDYGSVVSGGIEALTREWRAFLAADKPA